MAQPNIIQLDTNKAREHQEALRFLKSPDLIEDIIFDLTTLGYVGERNNKLLAYLIATSRLMDTPLAAVIQSRSSAGKSKLMDTIVKLLPDQDVVNITSATNQAFFYMDNLDHKLVCIGESHGLNKETDYHVRELLSAREISKLVPETDDNGVRRTVRKRVGGKIAFIMTTTNPKLNPENLSRCIMLSVDETKEQTEHILKFQRQSRTLEGIKQKLQVESIIRKHKAAQSLLEPVNVVIPYAEHLDFPAHRINSRRDQDKLLNLIQVIVFLHQHQRQKHTISIDDQDFTYIEATLQDYQIAYDLFMGGVIQNTLSDVPKMSRDLHKHIKRYVTSMAKQRQVGTTDILFTRKLAAKISDYSFAQVRNYMKVLEQYEIVEVVNADTKQKRKVYRLVEENLEELKLNMIPTPKQLQTTLEKEEKNNG